LLVAVVGSGASGMAAASVLLDAGHEVELLDAGRLPGRETAELAAEIRARPPGSAVDAALLARLKYGPGAQPGAWWRGVGALLRRGVDADRIKKRILASGFVFEGAEQGIPVAGAPIPRSLAQGGLSNVWGAACYALRADDYRYWPLLPEELEPAYADASALLGLEQQRDDLARAYPLCGAAAPLPARNPGSAAEALYARWRTREPALAARGFAAGRTRLAVRRPGDAGDACRECGLCVYGCAWDSIYSGRRTLEALRRRPGFAYRGGRLVLRFAEDTAGVRVLSRALDGGEPEERRYAALFLAAGTLSSLRIAADSQRLHGRPARLLDNDMYLLPVLMRGGGAASGFQPRFTLGELALALDPGVVTERALHLQLYSFHEYFLAELGLVFAGLPRALRRAGELLLNRLLLVFTYVSGADSTLAEARVEPGPELGRVEIAQRPNPRSREILGRLLRHLWRERATLGFWPLSPLLKASPLGFSGHLAGSLPMRREPGPLESHLDGRLAGTERVYVVDGAALPDLPAQNLTYTLAANAIRVARQFAAKAA
jgi:choline dehydrogenase-like flavoprotein